jgi:hypothetical protein
MCARFPTTRAASSRARRVRGFVRRPSLKRPPRDTGRRTPARPRPAQGQRRPPPARMICRGPRPGMVVRGLRPIRTGIRADDLIHAEHSAAGVHALASVDSKRLVDHTKFACRARERTAASGLRSLCRLPVHLNRHKGSAQLFRLRTSGSIVAHGEPMLPGVRAQDDEGPARPLVGGGRDVLPLRGVWARLGDFQGRRRPSRHAASGRAPGQLDRSAPIASVLLLN